ncbi:MAG: arylsulfatase [Planctomycetaceae bacterium]|nr:arylsulfatase [Planctomycetaceae bacterium]
MSRTLFPVKHSFLILLTALSSVATSAYGHEERPNVIVIFCDDLGYGDLGCFGHPTIRTPNIDRMAREGQRWTQFYAAAPVCTPSRAGLQTGRYPVRSGMCGFGYRVLFPDSKGGLPQSEITIARMLKDAGYSTHAVGKWHLGHLPEFLPTSHGYDTYFGIPYSNDMDTSKNAPPWKAQFADPKSEYWNVPLMRGESIIERPADQTTITERYTQETINLIRRKRKQPFFIYLAHNLPHVPLFVSKPFEDVSIRGLYGDVIEEIDASTGRILNALRDEGIAEDTLVVFTSDNGPWHMYRQQGGSAGLLRDAKGSTWEGGMREPTVFWWPGHIKPAVIMEVGSTLDLLPTFAGICDARLPSDRTIDGINLKEVLLHGEGDGRRELVYYHGDEVFALREGPFKAHFKTKTEFVGQQDPVVHDPPLLFNLQHDPAEKYDIASAHPKVVERLLARKRAHEAGVTKVPNQLILR